MSPRRALWVPGSRMKSLQDAWAVCLRRSQSGRVVIRWKTRLCPAFMDCNSHYSLEVGRDVSHILRGASPKPE